MHFHVLGTGAIGCLVASYLRQSNHTVTLLLKNAQSLAAYRMNGGITYEKEGVATKLRDFDLELAGDAFGRRAFISSPPLQGSIVTSADIDDPIDNLIVATKTYDTVKAVAPLIRRIGRQSTVILLQNGMGLYEDLTRLCFPDRSVRPNFVVGVNSHGAFRRAPFHVVHAGWRGDIHFGVVPREEVVEAGDSGSEFGSGAVGTREPPPIDTQNHDETSDNSTDRHNLPPPSASPHTDNTSSLTSSTDNHTTPSLSLDPPITTTPLDSTISALLALTPLNVHLDPWSDIQCRTLEKLVINSCINPVTALMRCRNGDLIGRRQGGQLIRSVCDEAASVISASGIISDPHARTRFTSEVLQQSVVRVCMNTMQNESSMLQDVKSKRVTEVDHMNGYLGRLGRGLGVPTPVNDTLLALVKLQHRLANKKQTKL